MLDVIWLIPAFPLLGFLLILVFGRRLGEPGAGYLAAAAVLGSFVVSVGAYVDLLGMDAEERSHVETLFSWVPVSQLQVDMAFLADPLSITMCLFVTGIAFLIHLFAIGYMHGDPKFSKFFLYLNLFVLSMTLLVLGENLLVTFLGWEGVGTCSYLLISFWHTKDANASAGKKAFVTNRIGDWGFMLAMFLGFWAVGSVSYVALNEAAELGALATSTATGIALLLFVGAVGKSAQLPLYVWLPDAMAGPTPVSALIHAATMVTAGVFLMVRMNPMLTAAADWAPTLIAWVGAITALFAATIALAQNDIKKVLAYSTVSQLGYMFLAVGSGAYVAAIFHMITHAFFKALMFLGSGSVIHGMHEEQDMRKMGALRKFMPVTASTFIIGWLAIAGVPPFAGFWSKDEILLFTLAERGVVLYVIGLITAVLTAFYMTRQVLMVFFGDAKWGSYANEAEAAHLQAHILRSTPTPPPRPMGRRSRRSPRSAPTIR
jgi:NADH-quinone oxidoreductase subunit L